MFRPALTAIVALSCLLALGSLTGCDKKEDAATTESATSESAEPEKSKPDKDEPSPEEGSDHMHMEGMDHGADEADGEPIHAGFMHDEMMILDERADVPKDFRAGLGHMYEHYIAMSGAMASDDLKAASTAANKMHEQMEKLDGATLEGKAGKAWKTHHKVMSNSLGHMMEAKNMKTMREQFSHMTEGMYASLHSFGGGDHAVHVAHCPMAMDGDGAFWLSTEKKIANPYMGSKMPGCGEIMATMHK